MKPFYELTFLPLDFHSTNPTIEAFYHFQPSAYSLLQALAITTITNLTIPPVPNQPHYTTRP
jgi:hypothetical protein